MARCYLLSDTWIRLFVYALYVGPYWGGFKTPTTSKMEHFVTKNLAIFQKKTVKKIC